VRRIIIHGGFHKTGTTSLQQTLRANRAALRPNVRLVLRPGMKALCECARAYSRSREDYDLGMVKYEAALLMDSLGQEQADTLILTSEDLSGHMPGRYKLHGYSAAPHLMRALSVAFKAARPGVELTFFFTTRSADAWLRSCYAQHVRAARMVWDEGDYIKRLRSSADHEKFLDLIKTEVRDHALIDAALEDYADRPLGIAEALLDHLDLNRKQRAALIPTATRKTALPGEITAQLLALNRSGLDDGALRTAKRRLIESAA
jgi:hypothetical protein